MERGTHICSEILFATSSSKISTNMVEVRKKPGETSAAMLRRFTRRVQQSGILLVARKSQFYRSKPTKIKMRQKALRRTAKLKEVARLEKLGKLKKEE